MLHELDREVGEMLDELNFKIGKVLNDFPFAWLIGKVRNDLHVKIREVLYDLDLVVGKMLHVLNFPENFAHIRLGHLTFPFQRLGANFAANAKLTGRTEPACRRSGLQRGVKFAKQMPRCKLSELNAWLWRAKLAGLAIVCKYNFLSFRNY